MVLGSLGIAPEGAIANTYSGQNLGGGAALSWRFTNPIDLTGLKPGQNNPPQRLGYACWTRDALGGMARTAFLYRYKIMGEPFTDNTYLVPLNGVTIRPGEKQLRSQVVEAEDPAVLKNLPKALSGTWFANNLAPEALDKACIDGGITAGLRQLSKEHGKPIVAVKPAVPVPTPNTYASGRFGFKFAYPQNYNLTTNENNLNDYIYLRRVEDKNEPEPPYISISVYKNPKGRSLAKVRDGLGFDVEGKTKQTTVAGQKGIEFAASGLYTMRNVMFPTPDGKHVVHLNVTLSTEKGDGPLGQDAKSILSNFQF
ncbi:hypothetical protein IQ266_18165 [filamentous cyanobacterium LEGE 11480]|uniref:Uncharacterized protein n=2 Tax=Romeriopsis TaxID=2992131 RepID=A0A928VRK0_9CYAN|nr:hypothetical protein [Romeriopsis navalis LEGE 11480]